MAKSPFLTILETLARKEESNQYQLRKNTRLAKKTIERWIPRLKAGEWITVERVERKRGPNPSEFYALTDLGRYAVASRSRISHLSTEQRERLGRTKYEAYVSRRQLARQQNADHWSQLVREALRAEKGTPGWHFTLEIRADKAGRMGWKAEVGFQ